MTPLQRRIAGCVPLLDFGLDAVLRVLTIEETDTIPTAAIPLGGTPRLLINPKFVAEVCPSDEDLAVLVLHELHHLLLGHTRLYPRISELHNIAFDAVINAMIARSRPQPRWLALFRRLYAADRFPEQLLRAPEGFPGPAVWPPEMPDGVRHVLTDLYYSGAGTFHDAFELLLRELPKLLGGFPLLLGSHGEGGAAADPAIAAAIRAIVQRWPPGDPRVGESINGALEVLVRTPAARREEPMLVTALLAAARVGNRAAGLPEPRATPALIAWPTRDRRAFALAASGTPPLLYAGSLRGRPQRAGLTPVAVYLDVSGSVNEYLPRLLAAVLSCRDRVAATIYQFSDDVEKVSLDELARGVIRTSFGTCGESFATHLAESGAKGAVVITDGIVGPIPSPLALACRRANLQVVLTPHGCRGDLEDAAAKIYTLEAA